MVPMVRLISGLLVLSLCAADITEVTTLRHLTDSNETTRDGATKEPLAIRYNTLTPLELKPITDEDVENIVRPLKFAKTNVTTLKLKKSEPYNSRPFNHDLDRTNSARSVDLDVAKFSAPVDHNAVYTSPEDEFNRGDKSFHSTEYISSLESIGLLTTPKTPFFDQKFQQTVDSIKKKLDFEDVALENSTSKNYSSDNYIDPLEANIEDEKFTYNQLELKNKSPGRRTYEKLEETRTTLNHVNKYNTSISYDNNPQPEESNELRKERIKLKPLLSDDSANEVKQNPSPVTSTTRSTPPVTISKYVLKKTTPGRNDPAVISNRIEGETTTLPSSTPSLSTIKPHRGSIKFSDYNRVSPSPDKPSEQTVEENQVVPVQVTAPNKEIAGTTTQKILTNSITTVKTKSIILSSQPDENQSTTVYIFVQPEDIKDLTTIKNEIEEVQKTSVASKPRAFQVTSSTSEVPKEISTTSQILDEVSTDSVVYEESTAVTSVPRGFSLPTTTEDNDRSVSSFEAADRTSTYSQLDDTIEDLDTTTINPTEDSATILYDTTKTNLAETTITSTESVTKSNEETNITILSVTDSSETTTLASDTTRVTTSLPEITTMIPPETTTVKREITTLSPETTTDSLETTTEFIETTEGTTVTDLRSSKNIKLFETTEAFSTPAAIITTQKSETTSEFPQETTVNDDEKEVTTIEITTMPKELTVTETKEKTFEPVMKTIILTTSTKTLLENGTTAGNVVTGTTPGTSFDFVHIKTIDSNHTTMTPDELKPNEIYTTPSSSETVEKSTTETSSDDTTSSGLDGPSSGSGTVVAIIISCVGGICLVALACLLIVMRNRQNRFNYGQRCRPVSLDDYSVDNVSVFNSVRRKAAIRGSKTSYGNPAFEDPVCLSHPLNFPAISKFASNEEDVTAEFKDIPQIIARTSELPEGCETKNRYANVIPLPESRVFLNHVEGYPNSDYINANFVTGPKNIRKYYIACQAPMSNTVDDFWRMIWEQQCKVVLMLTNLFEGGVEKCFDYLPPSEVLDCHRLFGDYQVTLKKREVKEKYIISSIQLKNMVSNSWREVTHFWYMGWPERGVPAEASSIIAFLIEARSYMKNATIDKKTIRDGAFNGTPEVNPVVVHCSPGTGRTGAVITCDIAIREFEQTRQVDIPKIVYKIRRDRAGAVQTKEQYAFIYKVVDFYATKLAGGNFESI